MFNPKVTKNLDWVPETHTPDLVRELKTTAAKKESSTVWSAPPAPVRDPSPDGEVWSDNDKTVEKLRAYVEGPLNAILVGATMTGKSTFVNEVLGLELNKAGVGDGLTSCTSVCRPYCKNLRDPDLKLNLIDSPGMFDSGGAKVDKENEDTIDSFLKQNHPDCVLLFLKFYEPADGKFMSACEFAASIAKVYQCNILVVNTFCDPPKVSAEESSFPTGWLESKLQERKEIGGTISLPQLWYSWKRDKESKTTETLTRLGIKKDRIFQCHSCFSGIYELMKKIDETEDIVSENRKSQYLLPDRTKMIPKILEQISNSMGPRALRLIRECCINEEARIGADDFLGRKLQTVLSSMGMVGACLTGLIEKVCNAVRRKNTLDAEFQARVDELHERLGYNESNSTTKKALHELLQSPIAAVMVGKTMTGKSTFANKVLGSGILRETELPQVGGGMVSCTSKCRKYGAKVKGVEFPLDIIDTPGLFDSSRSNKAVQSAILNFLRSHPPQIVFLFLKFSDPMDGAFETTCGFAAQIAQKYNCPILAVHTLCDQSFDFPASWVEEKLKALEGFVGAEATLWSLWADEKGENVVQQCCGSKIAHDHILQCHCSFPPRNNLDIIFRGAPGAEESSKENSPSLAADQLSSCDAVDEKISSSAPGVVLPEGCSSVGNGSGTEQPPSSRDDESETARVESSDAEGGESGVGSKNRARDCSDKGTVFISNLADGTVEVRERVGLVGEEGLSNPNEEGVVRPNSSEKETIGNIVLKLNRAIFKSIRMTLEQAEKMATPRRKFLWIW